MRLVHHLLLHAVAVAHCSELRSGLSHLFTTPILRHQLIDANDDQTSDLLATMESLVLRSFSFDRSAWRLSYARDNAIHVGWL